MSVARELDAAAEIVSAALPDPNREDLERARKRAKASLSSKEISPGLAESMASLAMDALRPTRVLGFMPIAHSRRAARSYKLYNIKLDLFQALRNFLGPARDASMIAAAGGLGTWLATGLASMGGLVGVTIVALGFIVGAHFAVRKEVQYDQGCLLVLAWSASEYIDGRHILDEAVLFEQLPLMKEFGIHDYTEAKARTVLASLVSWGMMEKDGPAYILRESVKVSR
jgi:hypothetical protein